MSGDYPQIWTLTPVEVAASCGSPRTCTLTSPSRHRSHRTGQSLCRGTVSPRRAVPTGRRGVARADVQKQPRWRRNTTPRGSHWASNGSSVPSQCIRRRSTDDRRVILPRRASITDRPAQAGRLHAVSPPAPSLRRAGHVRPAKRTARDREHRTLEGRLGRHLHETRPCRVICMPSKESSIRQ